MAINFGISQDIFAKLYQEKRPLLIRKAVRSHEFSWEDANGILERSDVMSDDFKLSCDGIRPKDEYIESYMDIGVRRYRLFKPVVYDYMRKGATLISNKIKFEPLVDLYARKIADFTGRQTVSSVYAAFGERDSFRCHWDTRDVFAIQLIGRKRWLVYEPSFESPLYTQQSKDLEHLFPCPSEPYMDVVMEAGDVIYVPRGWWHNPLPLGEGTFHLAVGTFPAYLQSYLAWAVEHMQDYPVARRSLAGWQHDQDNLVAMGKSFDAFINDPDNYRRFEEEFVAGIRMDSPLALDVFGNPSAVAMPDNTRLRISAASRQMSDAYIIANGTKLNLDEQSLRLLGWVIKHPEGTLGEMVSTFSEFDVDKLRDLVMELCRLDILEIVRLSQVGNLPNL